MIEIEREMHQLLVAWAQWARGNSVGGPQRPQAGSIESNYLPEAGDVHEGLQAPRMPVLPDAPMIQVEIAVMRLPARPRLALRLHYVVHKRLPVAQKLRMLGTSWEAYKALIERGAGMLKERLDKKGKLRTE
jgi:DNA-directed RNA polymerase specialized sigma24 family protein